MVEKKKKAAEDFTELKQFKLDPESVRLLYPEFCRKNLVVVLEKPAPGQPVTVGMTDPSDLVLVRAASNLLLRPVRPVRLNAYEIRHALNVGFGEEEALQEEFRLFLQGVPKIDFSPELPIVKILDQILGHAILAKASDIHIETYEDDIDVRFRVDGLLRQEATPLSRENIQAFIARLKVLAGMDITEKRRAQDGRILAVFEDGQGKRKVDFRLSVVPGSFGEDAVLRILESQQPLIGLEKLGFPEGMMEDFVQLVQNPEGLILVTGPTGSGKTTTLYSALLCLKSEEKKILTVEDPIEYTFDKVNQKQISTTMGFADYARAFMRQNPDIILIGEIRDEPTADAAIRAAQTGHLVFSTLHANDAVQTAGRLLTLGVEPGMASSVLLGVLSQRLTRRLCPACKVVAEPGEKDRKAFRLAPDAKFFAPQGCPECGGRGYKGRVGVFELFVPDEEVREMIAHERPGFEIRRTAIEKGMTTLLQDALAKARLGLTSLEEIRRIVPHRMLAAEFGPGEK